MRTENRTIYLDSLDVQELESAGEVVSDTVMIMRDHTTFIEPSTWLTARIGIDESDLKILKSNGSRALGEFRLELE